MFVISVKVSDQYSTANVTTPAFVHTVAYTPYHLQAVPFGENQSPYPLSSSGPRKKTMTTRVTTMTRLRGGTFAGGGGAK